jgi:hypothetical protein
MIRLSTQETDLLHNRIQNDHSAAISDHNKRMSRFRDLWRKWRNIQEQVAVGEEEASNFQVPMMQWFILSKVAMTAQALLGDDAEIVAEPVGQQDQKLVRKIGRYMSWRVFKSMKITDALVVWLFRSILFGRAFAFRPWVRETYKVKKGKKVEEQIWYDGPGFIPLWPQEIIVPAEPDAQCIHDFSFVIRRHYATPQQLLDGERDGRYIDVTKNFKEILRLSQGGRSRDIEGDEFREDIDQAEGVHSEGFRGEAGTILVHSWYGKHRMPKGKGGGDYYDIKNRALDETEIVVHYLPDLNMNIGVVDLMDMYPTMKNRRPFVEMSITRDGSYWPMGIGELIQDICTESTVNHNLFTEAGEMTAGPVIFFRPSSGFNPNNFRYEPGMAYPTENPDSVKMFPIKADFQYSILKDQQLTGMAEKVTGVSDQTMGRSSDRPNAPRTATGQTILMEQGNVRASLDHTLLREDLSRLLADLWALDCDMSEDSVFFRVTEEDAGGMFATTGGAAEMTSEERGGRYDFSLKFATSVWSKEAKKQERLQLYQLDLGNPLVAQNPRALWVILNDVHRAFGDDNFANIIPEPPDLGQPKNPKEEWALMLQGEETPVNPMDNDQLHIAQLIKYMNEMRNSARPDMGAMTRAAAHVVEHQKAMRQKAMMQALTQELMASVAQNTATGEGGIDMAGGVPMPIQNMQAALGDIVGGGQQQGGDPNAGA